VPNFLAIGPTVAELRRFFDFFKAAVRHLGFVMRVFGPGTTHEGYLVVFINVQTLFGIGIDAIILIIGYACL